MNKSTNLQIFILKYAGAACFIAVFAFAGMHLLHRSFAAGGGSAIGTPVCGQAILNSPYTYNGAAGAYSSGTAGLPTYGTAGSDFPSATAGMVLATGTQDFASFNLNPNTVYYLLPGTHIGSFQADAGDAFVGGLSGGTPTTLSGNYSGRNQAIDSNSSDGDQPGVTIEYLTIEKYQPDGDAAAINQEANTSWTLKNDTVTLNVPGAGMIAGANNTLKNNCLTLNGQYGFQSTDVNGYGTDSLTGGPYNVTIDNNEISYNDTCDFSGLLNNANIGWTNFNPVPVQYQNSECGSISGDGNQGGFKLWLTNGVTVNGNYIHNNWGPGVWVDTDNANTTISNNTITDNEGQAIFEEISYNFSITNNYLGDNGWADGLNNAGFPTPAIYVSESGSDSEFGGVPPCSESSCSDQSSYSSQSVISNNTLVDNSGSIFLWQNSNRNCDDGFDGVCTLVDGGASGPFTPAACSTNMSTGTINTTTFAGNHTGSPSEDWWDGCEWHTQNVSVTQNEIDFNPANVMDCNQTDWSYCGAGGIFSEYSSSAPYTSPGGWAIPTQLTFFQNDAWSNNVYNGPSTFYGWNQGNNDNPVSWADWSGSLSGGDKCTSSAERQSGGCTGPFGQDSGSTFNSTPLSSTPPPSTPNSVNATANSPTSVTVTWGASTDTGGPGLGGYDILRGGSQVASVGAGTTSYTDTTASGSTQYSYTVEAFDTALPPNVSTASAASVVTTPSSAQLPTVGITSLTNNQLVHGIALAVNATAAPFSGNSISQAQLLVNGNVVQTLNSTPFNFSLDTLNYVDGSYAVSIRATDNHGNVGSQSLTLTLTNGDINTDNKVNISDLAIMAVNWGKLSGGTYVEGDINSDAKINVQDLAVLANNWEKQW